jgi:hypothetical protein
MAHETEKTARGGRIEIAAAITSGSPEWHTRPRRRFARCAEKNALAQRLLAIASHRDQRCVSLQADLLRHSVGPAA